MMKHGLVSTASVTVIVLSLAVPATAQTYNPFTEFSVLSNPNGVWSYGQTPTLGGTFTLFNDFQGSGTVQGWRDNSGALQLPGIFKNVTGAVLIEGTVTHPATDVLNLHPGSAGNYSVLRFTVPSSGSYTLAGRYQALDNTTTDVHIRRNSGTSLFSSTITGTGANPDPDTSVRESFNIPVALNAGDTIDFAVGVGGNQSFFNDSTGLALTITNTTAAPEPGTVLLTLLGLAVSGTLVRRRA